MVAKAQRTEDNRTAQAMLVALLALVLAVGSAFAAIGANRAQNMLVPVIVRHTSSESTTAADAAAGQATLSVVTLGGSVGRRLAVINGFSALVPASALGRLATMPGIVSVTPDVALSALDDNDDYEDAEDDDSVEAQGGPTTTSHTIARQIGARWFWALGYTGKGVDVAVIDTGLSPVAGLSGSGKVVNGPDLSFEAAAGNLRQLDTYGHGTHMAGIIAGRDAGIAHPALAGSDEFLGIAPGARIVNVKVANATGATDVSQVIAAIDWVVANKDSGDLNIRVINLSFGTDGVQHYTLDPLAFAVEQAWHAGIVVVVAAGNGGFGSAKLNNPAYNPWVIAVGASDPRGTTTVSDDVIPPFSSTGDKQRNPDLVAPGKSIASLRVAGSQLDLNFPAGRVGSRYFKGSGTSQAAAVVSGAAALIIDQRPKITPDQLKQLMKSTALELPNADPIAQGEGALYMTRILTTSTPKNATQSWPRSSGTGSLDASRGKVRVLDPNGVELRGEQDIFGRPFDGGQWGTPCEPTEQPTEASEPETDPRQPCLTWSGNSWSGNSWSGNSWSGNSWSGNSWSGNSWSGHSWAESCLNNTWNGNSWSGNSWSGNSWSGNSWSGNSWSGTNWSSSGWLGVSWGKKPR